MANIAFTAIRARIREVLQDGEGLIRTVTQGRVGGDYWSGAPAEVWKPRALIRPRIDVLIDNYGPHSATGPGNHSLRVYQAEATVVSAYLLPEPVLGDTARDAAIATAEQDGEVIAQALSWPGNLHATEGGTVTGIIGGCLTFAGWSVGELDWNERTLVTNTRFTFHVSVTAAVS